VAENGLKPNDQVLFLDKDGVVLESITSPLGPVDPDEARVTSRELLNDGRLAAVVHLFRAWDYRIQFGVVEIFAGADSTIHGIVNGTYPQWIPIPSEVADQWGQTWNQEGR
jgi:hypothetical protein